LGEYSVLQQGPAIVLVHPPCFSFSSTSSGFDTCPFPKGSPAERLWQSETARGISLGSFTFFDPHGGQGGFGGSTAEFAFTAMTLEASTNKNLDIWDWHQRYLDFFESESVKPSGVDLIAQLATRNSGEAKFVWVELAHKKTETCTLQPPIFIVRTGNKIKTHEHLASLSQQQIDPALADITRDTWLALQQKNWPKLGKNLSLYQGKLQTQGLLAIASQALLEKMKTLPGYLGAKGCGAMGADALLLCFRPQELLQAQSACRDMGLTIVWTP
jgi:hypothetical protein